MKKHLYFKITTIPQTENVEGKELELYFKKYQEINKLENLKQSENDYYENAGKNPLFGKIHSLTVGYVHDNTLRITVLKGNEVNILKEFINICNNDYYKDYQIASWNFAFVLPFLRIRATKNNIHFSKLHADTQDLAKKPWTITGCDLFEHWKGLGWFQSSLEEVATLTFNQEVNFIDGADVYKYFKNGKLQELDTSSINELQALINIHNVIKGQEVIDEVVSNVLICESEIVEKPLLDRLYDSKSITNADKEELKQIFAKKKLKTEEKEIAINIIKASLSEINQNFGSITNSKEVEEMIKGLGL